MGEKSEFIKSFKCNVCEKNYSSQSSLCNHNKKFHKTNITENNGNITKTNGNITETNGNIKNKLVCKYCNKIFKHIQNRYEHEKNVCSKKNNIFSNVNIELEEFKNNILELLQKNAKIHPKTLQKINKQLINNNNTTNNNNTNNTNNGVINHGSSAKKIEDFLAKKGQKKNLKIFLSAVLVLELTQNSVY
jgi:hypothetical protein